MPDEKKLVGDLVPKAYDDVVSPSAKLVGEAVKRAVALTLRPVNGVLWTAEQAADWLERRVEQLLVKKGVLPERVVPPPPALLGAVITGARSAVGDPTLCEMFASLLATSMDSATADSAHPAFARMLQEMVPDEARIIRSFWRSEPNELAYPVTVTSLSAAEESSNINVIGIGCERPMQSRVYVDNLLRMGLAERRPVPFSRIVPEMWGTPTTPMPGTTVILPEVAIEVLSRMFADKFPANHRGSTLVIQGTLTVVALTDFGWQFAHATGCIDDPPLSRAVSSSIRITREAPAAS